MDFFKKGQQMFNKQNHAGSSSQHTTTTTTGQPAANGQQMDYGDKGTIQFPILASSCSMKEMATEYLCAYWK